MKENISRDKKFSWSKDDNSNIPSGCWNNQRSNTRLHEGPIRYAGTYEYEHRHCNQKFDEASNDQDEHEDRILLVYQSTQILKDPNGNEINQSLAGKVASR